MQNEVSNPFQGQSPNLFEFDNYRTFLAAHFVFKKKANPRFSYSNWARQLGLKNNTSLLKILNGSRDAGPDITRKLVEYFRFNDKQRLFFEDLVRLAKSKHDGALQVAIMERLKRHHPLKKFHLLEESEFSVIADWWHYAIRQFTKLKKFQNDQDWIAKHLLFKVSPKQVTKAIASLIEIGLLNKTDAQLIPTTASYNTTNDVSSEAIKRFHEGMLENAHKAVRLVEPKDRNISGLTLAFASKDLPAAKEMLRKFQDDFDTQFGGATEPDSVYHLEIAFFPLTDKSLKETQS